MIGVDINCQLMERQLRIDKSWSRLRYKAAMQTKDKIQRTAATEIGARILEVIGDDYTLQPDTQRTIEAAQVLIKEGF